MSVYSESVTSAPESPRRWKSGEPYHFALPKPNGDGFELLFQHLLNGDQSQFNAWRDEVNNLLLFAGLLSAVVTAFVIETYKNLSLDSNNTIINLLSVLALREGNGGNSSNIFTPQPTVSDPYQHRFTPSSWAVSFNILFFISLVLSLSTALIGIVCLQWLTVHQSYPSTLPACDRLALIHMRREAFKQWRIPEMFAALPILIQLALVTFFLGLGSFLWSIDGTVAIPVTVLIGLTLLFLVATTIIPTLQIFLLQRPYLLCGKGMPTECPYMSPQAAACRYLATSSQTALQFFSFLFSSAILIPIRIYRCSALFSSLMGKLTRQLERLNLPSNADSMCVSWSLGLLPLVKRGLRRLGEWNCAQLNWVVSSINKFNSPANYVNPLKLLFTAEDVDDRFPVSRATNTWADVGLGWLNVRDMLFRDHYGLSQQLRYRRADEFRYFDIVQSIQAIISDNTSLTDQLISAAVHCTQRLPCMRGLFVRRSLETVVHYCSTLFNSSVPRKGDLLVVENVPEEVLDEHNVKLLLQCVDLSQFPDASSLLTETNLRLMAYVYDEQRTLDEKLGQFLSPFDLAWSVYYTPDDSKKFLLPQLALNIDSFFKAIISHGNSDEIRKTALAKVDFQQYLVYLHRYLRYWNRDVTSQARMIFSSTLHVVNNALIETTRIRFIDNKPEDAVMSHSLFYCAAFSFDRFKQGDIPGIDLRDLHNCLKTYKEYAKLTPRPHIQTSDPFSPFEMGGRLWMDWNDSEHASTLLLFSESWWKRFDDWSSYAQNNDALNSTP